MKNFEVVLHKAVLGELRKLPATVRQRVKDAIDELPNDPTPPGAARLKGSASAYRLRFGDYRMLYEVHATEIVVYVLGVGHRREVYQRLLKRRVK